MKNLFKADFMFTWKQFFKKVLSQQSCIVQELWWPPATCELVQISQLEGTSEILDAWNPG